MPIHDFDALRERIPFERCPCGAVAQTFVVSGETVRFVCFDDYMASRTKERGRTRAALRQLHPTLFV